MGFQCGRRIHFRNPRFRCTHRNFGNQHTIRNEKCLRIQVHAKQRSNEMFDAFRFTCSRGTCEQSVHAGDNAAVADLIEEAFEMLHDLVVSDNFVPIGRAKTSRKALYISSKTHNFFPKLMTLVVTTYRDIDQFIGGTAFRAMEVKIGSSPPSDSSKTACSAVVGCGDLVTMTTADRHD